MNSRMTPRGTPLGAPVQQYVPGSNAALLIDFDNVTMGIRSDLGKELRALLNSDVIRGKVAVQRAYADWRRYPQYIVPLAENSVDLIFAPAYGSAKKNATDLRMAIDAIELVFTRPEIGTYILMTGDSDFSSCVLKLKEYGKYVIGVGMRESSSDLLIQNCDEYYSYHALSGLTRAGEVEESTEDPWVLVKRAVQQMVRNGDVMRTDRLKQVMLDIDPGFDEKKIGYSKFSRFVSEAASKNLLKLRKTENGQYEILSTGGGAGSGAEEAATSTASPAESREKVVERIVADAEASAGNGRRRGRGRGRDDRGRDRSPREEVRSTDDDAVAAAPADAQVEKSAPAVQAADIAPAAGSETTAAPESAPQEVVREVVREAPAASAAMPADTPVTIVGDIDGAYALLQEAVRRLVGRDSKSSIRDGDVKRRMLEISRDFDEGKFGFPKFTRFLRQAHDAEVIDLVRNAGGNYEVSLPAGGKKLAPPKVEAAGDAKAADAAPAAESSGRERGRGRGSRKSDAAPRQEEAPVRAEAAEATAPTEPEKKTAPERRERASTPAVKAPEKTASSAAETAAAPAATAPSYGALRGRRGGRTPLDGPPPILPGQGVVSPLAAQGSDSEQASTSATASGSVGAAEEKAAEASAEQDGEATEGKSRSRRGRRGGRGRGRSAGAEDVAATSEGGESPAETSEEKVAASAGAAEAVAAVDSISAAADEAAPRRTSRSRSRSRGKAATADKAPVAEATEAAAAQPSAEPVAEAAAKPAAATKSTRGRKTAKAAATGTPANSASRSKSAAAKASEAAPAAEVAPAAGTGVPSLADLGLPGTVDEVRRYLGGYTGVGVRTAEALVDRFGADVFEALQSQPEEVVTLLGARRARSVIDQWIADFDQRVAERGGSAPVAEAAAAPAATSKRTTGARKAAAKRTGATAKRGRSNGSPNGSKSGE